MITHRHVAAAWVVACGACSTGKPTWVPPDRTCAGPLRPVWMADPNYTMCVETSFRTQNLQAWHREQAERAADVLSVQLGVGQAQVDLMGGWPPHLVSSKDTVNGALVGSETVITRADTVNGVVFHTELEPYRRRPPSGATAPLRFVSGFRTPDGGYVIATGESANGATLDTLLMMFRSVARSAVPDPNRRR